MKRTGSILCHFLVKVFGTLFDQTWAIYRGGRQRPCLYNFNIFGFCHPCTNISFNFICVFGEHLFQLFSLQIFFLDINFLIQLFHICFLIQLFHICFFLVIKRNFRLHAIFGTLICNVREHQGYQIGISKFFHQKWVLPHAQLLNLMHAYLPY